MWLPVAVRSGGLVGAVPPHPYPPGRPPPPCSHRPARRRGSVPSPGALRAADLALPGRKTEYLHAVADAALDGRLNGATLRAVDSETAIRSVQEIKGLGPFAAELVVLRGANAPDVLPRRERRLEVEIVERYGTDRTPAEVSEAWRPFRTWAAVHQRTARTTHTRDRVTRPPQVDLGGGASRCLWPASEASHN